MNIFRIEEQTTYDNYVGFTTSGFKLICAPKNRVVERCDVENNCILFVLEGVIELSCDEYVGRPFKAGSMVFLPQSSHLCGRLITDGKLIILVFDSRVVAPNDKYSLSQYAPHCSRVTYDFRGLTLRAPLYDYLQLLEIYLRRGMNSVQLHELKRQELFFIFQTAYSPIEMAEFFYPILDKDLDFRANVLAKYRMGYSIKEFAEELSMHEKYFPKKFKQVFGISFYQWMLAQKATHVKRKLTHPQTTIKEVVQEFGFSNFAHFNRFCKKQFGCTPTSLVKQLRS